MPGTLAPNLKSALALCGADGVLPVTLRLIIHITAASSAAASAVANAAIPIIQLGSLHRILPSLKREHRWSDAHPSDHTRNLDLVHDKLHTVECGVEGRMSALEKGRLMAGGTTAQVSAKGRSYRVESAKARCHG